MKIKRFEPGLVFNVGSVQFVVLEVHHTRVLTRTRHGLFMLYKSSIRNMVKGRAA